MMIVAKQIMHRAEGPDGFHDTAAGREDGHLGEALAPREAEGAHSRGDGRPCPRGTPDRCPRCGSADFCRKGHDAHGFQRWRCRSCGRTFSAKTGSVLAMSKLDAATWAAYAEGTLAGMSLRELADSCSVCLRTSWFMRMRLFEVMGSALAPFRKGPSVSCQADGLCLDESLAGSRGRSDIQMPGKAHAHGHAVHPRGISSRKVCLTP